MKKLSISLLIVGFVGVVVGAILKIEGKGNFANSIMLSSIFISLIGVLLVLVKGNGSVKN